MAHQRVAFGAEEVVAFSYRRQARALNIANSRSLLNGTSFNEYKSKPH
jgi:hypothetical protein